LALSDQAPDLLIGHQNECRRSRGPSIPERPMALHDLGRAALHGSRASR
jgi:hypothetical protein